MPGNKDGLGHIKGGKTGQRDIIKGQECIRFVRKGELNEDEYLLSTQKAEVPRSERRGSAVRKADTQNSQEG
jgi:hypothetical protein